MSALDVVKGLKELSATIEDYEIARDFHKGTAPEVFNSVAVNRALKGKGKDFETNFLGVVVDAVLNMLEVNSVTTTDKKANELIDVVKKNNLFDIESRNIHEKALRYGDCYAIVWLDDDDDVVIDYNSPLTTRIVYDTRNPRKKKYGISSWLDDNDLTRVDVYYPDFIERWVSVTKISSTTTLDAESFEIYLDDDQDESNWLIENPFGEIPIIHFGRNNKPEHYVAYAEQNKINKYSADQVASIDFFTFPIRWATTKNGIQALSTGGELKFDEDADETPMSDEESQELIADPSVVNFFKNVEKFGQFESGDPKAYIEPIRECIQNISTTTGTPIWLFANGGNPPSGEALKTGLRPLIKKVKNRQLVYGAAWEELFSLVLKFYGYDLEVAIAWTNADETDTKDSWEIAELKKNMGVPQKVVLMELGYTQEQVDLWFPDTNAITPVTDATPEVVDVTSLESENDSPDDVQL